MAGIVLESIAACRRATYCLRFLRVNQSPYVMCPPLTILQHQGWRHISSDGPGDKNGKDQLPPMKTIQLGQGQLGKNSDGTEATASPPDPKDKPAEKRTELPFEVRPEIPMEVQPNRIQPAPLEIKPPNPHPIICTSDSETFDYEATSVVDPSIESEAKSYDSSSNELIPPPVVNLMDDQTPSSTTTGLDESIDSPFISIECDLNYPSMAVNEYTNSRYQAPSIVTSKLTSHDSSVEPNDPNTETRLDIEPQISPIPEASGDDSKRKYMAPGSVASLDLKVKPEERKSNLQSSPSADISEQSSWTETTAVDSGWSQASSFGFPGEGKIAEQEAKVDLTIYSKANDGYGSEFGHVFGTDKEQKRPSKADTIKENVVDNAVIDQWVDKFKRLYMAENAAFGLNNENQVRASSDVKNSSVSKDDNDRNRLQNMVMKDNKWVFGNKNAAEPSSFKTAKSSPNDQKNEMPMQTIVINESVFKKKDTAEVKTSTAEKSSLQFEKDKNRLHNMVMKDNKWVFGNKTDKSIRDEKKEKPMQNILIKDNEAVFKKKDAVEAISSTINKSQPGATLPLKIEAKLKAPNDKKDTNPEIPKVNKDNKTDFKSKDTVEKVSTPFDPLSLANSRSSHEGDYPLDIDLKPKPPSYKKEEKRKHSHIEKKDAAGKESAPSNPVVSKTSPGGTFPVNQEAVNQSSKDKKDAKPMMPIEKKDSVTVLKNKDIAGPISPSPKPTLSFDPEGTLPLKIIGNPDAPTEFKESKKDLPDSDKDTSAASQTPVQLILSQPAAVGKSEAEITGSSTDDSQKSTEEISSSFDFKSDSKADDDNKLQSSIDLLDKDQEKPSSKTTEEIVAMFEDDYSDYLKRAEDDENLDGRTMSESIKSMSLNADDDAPNNDEKFDQIRAEKKADDYFTEMSQADVLGTSGSGSLNKDDATPKDDDKLDQIRAEKKADDYFTEMSQADVLGTSGSGSLNKDDGTPKDDDKLDQIRAEKKADDYFTEMSQADVLGTSASGSLNNEDAAPKDDDKLDQIRAEKKPDDYFTEMSQADVLGTSGSGSLNKDEAPNNDEKLDQIRAEKEADDYFSEIMDFEESINAEQKHPIISSSVDMEDSKTDMTFESTNLNLAETASSFVKASNESDSSEIESREIDQENMSSTDEINSILQDTEQSDKSQTETTSLLPNDLYDPLSEEVPSPVPLQAAELEESEDMNPDPEGSDVKKDHRTVPTPPSREESKTKEKPAKKEKPQLEQGELAMKLLDKDSAEIPAREVPSPAKEMLSPATDKPTSAAKMPPSPAKKPSPAEKMPLSAEKIPGLGSDSRPPGEKSLIQKLFEKILGGRGKNDGKRQMSTYTVRRQLSSSCTVEIPPSCFPSEAKDFRQESPVQTLNLGENQELQPNHEVILQEADVMLFAKKTEDLTEIKGGSPSCLSPKKSPRELMKEKQNSKKITILGGSEECAKKMKHLKELTKKTDDEDCERDHFSISQFCSQLRLSIFSGSPKSYTK
ncbi:uncharacterized protein LOC110177131 [Drosophila serrata]|uniref:uncharacterized protein LOC110177131 n=1 Tax=Drosophila serrata TaxID=7274 RepID=UPI000A1D159E|nr:uncharacterized protein LOC110177131 [Drosophila serrata]